MQFFVSLNSTSGSGVRFQVRCVNPVSPGGNVPPAGRIPESRSDVLVRIKRAVLAGRYRFSEKPLIEMETDGLDELDVLESILNSVAIYKTVRSVSARKGARDERLYIIQSTNLAGLPIYSKGKLVAEGGEEVYYFLISSKGAL